MQIAEKAEIMAEWVIYFTDIHTGKISKFIKKNNKVVDGGLANMAALLIGEVPSGTAAMHCVIGASNTSAEDLDTITNMEETIRKSITTKTRTGGVARLRTVFFSHEANGDHQCLGIVARATDQAGSGELLNRLVQPFSKDDDHDMTIECRFIFQRVVS